MQEVLFLSTFLLKVAETYYQFFVAKHILKVKICHEILQLENGYCLLHS